MNEYFIEFSINISYDNNIRHTDIISSESAKEAIKILKEEYNIKATDQFYIKNIHKL